MQTVLGCQIGIASAHSDSWPLTPNTSAEVLTLLKAQLAHNFIGHYNAPGC